MKIDWMHKITMKCFDSNNFSQAWNALRNIHLCYPNNQLRLRNSVINSTLWCDFTSICIQFNSMHTAPSEKCLSVLKSNSNVIKLNNWLNRRCYGMPHKYVFLAKRWFMYHKFLMPTIKPCNFMAVVRGFVCVL